MKFVRIHGYGSKCSCLLMSLRLIFFIRVKGKIKSKILFTIYIFFFFKVAVQKFLSQKYIAHVEIILYLVSIEITNLV